MFSEFSRKKPDVIILDYHLDGIDKNAMNGIETLD
jgi:CheY-like chemotaxis protein